jgi:HNH endonuclease/AP2 domain
MVTDLTGQRFERLAVLERAGSDKPGTFWTCRCDCGVTKIVRGDSLQSGRSKSCGCLMKQLVSMRKRLLKANQVTHQSDGTTVLVLERRNGEKIDCYLDTQDYDRVKDFRWSVGKYKHTSYVQKALITKSDGRRTTLLMHSVLLPDARLVDHKDGNGLNNRRSNLRPATHRQNSGNARKIRRKTTSRYRGVSLHKCGRFVAAIRNGTAKRISLGLFVSEIEAARAYNRAASKIFGEFAKLNDIAIDKVFASAFRPLPISQRNEFEVSI